MKNFPILYIVLSVFGLCGLLAPSVAYGQDVSINVLSVPATIPLSTTGSIQVDICNTDPNTTTVPVNTLNPQISVGSNVTILGVTNVDGSPLTNFTISSNTGKLISLSNSTPLPNPNCLSFKVIVRGDVVDTPGNVGGIMATLVFQNAQTGNKTFNDNSATSVVVTQPKWDLVPLIYTQPIIVYGSTNITVVVDVLELKSVATSGAISVRLTRDALLNLNFDPNVTSLGDRSVQNSVWSLDISDPSYYILTTNQTIAAGGKLSFGLSGFFNPDGTTGLFTISSTIVDSGNEQKITNNTSVNKIEYFNQ